MTFNFPKHLIIIDIESTGTSLDYSSIIQLGAVIFSKYGYLVEGGFSKYVLPYTPEWTLEAEQVHGISFGQIQEIGEAVEKVLEDFEAWISGYCTEEARKGFWLAQWGANFDVPLLKKAYENINRQFPFHYRTFDIGSIVRFELARRGQLRVKCGEGICAKALGIKVNEANEHDALYDARLSGLMLQEIVKRGRL